MVVRTSLEDRKCCDDLKSLVAFFLQNPKSNDTFHEKTIKKFRFAKSDGLIKIGDLKISIFWFYCDFSVFCFLKSFIFEQLSAAWPPSAVNLLNFCKLHSTMIFFRNRLQSKI